MYTCYIYTLQRFATNCWTFITTSTSNLGIQVVNIDRTIETYNIGRVSSRVISYSFRNCSKNLKDSLLWYHRDLKASNILMSASGMAKIGDCGLAKVMEDSLVSASGTPAGTFACAAVNPTSVWNPVMAQCNKGFPEIWLIICMCCF